jgi:hypothetical protein
MDRNYGGVIWTNHALDRLRERGVKQGDAWATFSNPESSRYAATEGGWVYYRTYGRDRLEVVAKQNDRQQWIILSVWSRPIYGQPASTHREPDLLDKILDFLLGGLRRRFSRK